MIKTIIYDETKNLREVDQMEHGCAYMCLTKGGVYLKGSSDDQYLIHIEGDHAEAVKYSYLPEGRVYYEVDVEIIIKMKKG